MFSRSVAIGMWQALLEEKTIVHGILKFFVIFFKDKVDAKSHWLLIKFFY